MNRKKFIKKVLYDVASYLYEKDNYDATHTYGKGYLANADILAHNFICDAIIERFPKDIIYSEEDEGAFTNKINKNSFFWVLDPICGSANYIKKFPFYVHSISVFDKNGVLYSGIYDPNHDDLFLADRQVTKLNDVVVNVSDVKKLNDALISINCNQSYWGKEKTNLVKLVSQFAPPTTRRLHILESANLELAYVSCGRLDAYVNPDDKLWDIAAGSLMINSAGGKTTLLSGKLYPPSTKSIGVIASNNYLNPIIDKIYKSD